VRPNLRSNSRQENCNMTGRPSGSQ
jgi:hypothetical protein